MHRCCLAAFWSKKCPWSRFLGVSACKQGGVGHGHSLSPLPLQALKRSKPLPPHTPSRKVKLLGENSSARTRMRQTLSTRTLLYNRRELPSDRDPRNAGKVLPPLAFLLAAPALGGSHIPLEICFFLLPLSSRATASSRIQKIQEGQGE